MCFEPDSLPPVRRIAGAAVSHDEIQLGAADGNRLAAFEATPEEPNGIGIVVLPDVRGLYRFYEELALRFAERGYHAVAIDYFGRTAGVAKRDDDFEYREHVAQSTQEGIRADIRAAVESLRPRTRAVLRPRRATASPAPSASTGCPASGTASPGRRSARASRRPRSWPFRQATTSTSRPS